MIIIEAICFQVMDDSANDVFLNWDINYSGYIFTDF